MSEKRVLCVGLTCLDIVTEVDAYPKEDTDQRSKGMTWRRGGNATNNCTVLKQLGVDCEFYGSLSQGFKPNVSVTQTFSCFRSKSENLVLNFSNWRNAKFLEGSLNVFYNIIVHFNWVP